MTGSGDAGQFDLGVYVEELTATLQARVDAGDAAAAAKLRQLEGRLDDLDDAVATSTAADDPVPDLDDAGEVELGYPDVEAWVRDHFAQVYVRPLGGAYRWCSSWWDHPEAIVRFEALWRSWETLRLDPNTGIATWLTQHLDPQLHVLLSAAGPFARCAVDRHEAGKPLPVEPAPDGWWDRGPA